MLTVGIQRDVSGKKMNFRKLKIWKMTASRYKGKFPYYILWGPAGARFPADPTDLGYGVLRSITIIAWSQILLLPTPITKFSPPCCCNLSNLAFHLSIAYLSIYLSKRLFARAIADNIFLATFVYLVILVVKICMSWKSTRVWHFLLNPLSNIICSYLPHLLCGKIVFQRFTDWCDQIVSLFTSINCIFCIGIGIK